MNDNWKVNCKFAFDEWQRIRDEWHTYDAIQLGQQASSFYSRVFYAGKNKSGLISNGALDLPNSKVTDDHWMGPRMLIRSMMANKPEILDDYNEWEDIFWNLAMNTIAITSEENGIVKFKNKKGKIKINPIKIINSKVGN